MAGKDSADADEFYVLRFSPAVEKNNYSGLNGVWYYNISLSGKRLSSDTKLITDSRNGTTYYELLLPWSEIPPYTPFLKEGVGFNLCFVKAECRNDRIFYYSLYDQKIQWEQNKRKYLNVKFETPALQKPISDFAPHKKTIFEGENITGLVSINSPCDTTVQFIGSIAAEDEHVLSSVSNNIDVKKGFHRYNVVIPAADLVEGGYHVRWRLGNGDIKILPVTVLPEFNTDEIVDSLLKNEKNISSGSRNTLLYRVNEIKELLGGLKYYEAAGQIREKIIKLKRDIGNVEKGIDPYAGRKGIFRRAYSSQAGGQYIPYSVKIPESYSRDKKYPMLVVLHGSGQLDEGMLGNADFGAGKFIEIAPSGRGTSNCFATDDAQYDISECIRDAEANYNIDESKIFLAGFSMGGYGVFRTYYETPSKFAGLAVFSGHPNLANKWLGGQHPDFTESGTLKLFNKIPLFVYHDKNDLNCPFDIMERTVNKLIEAGARVEFVTSAGLGHNILNDSNSKRYYSWLDEMLIK